jgi:hypothetical protein
MSVLGFGGSTSAMQTWSGLNSGQFPKSELGHRPATGGGKPGSSAGNAEDPAVRPQP